MWWDGKTWRNASEINSDSEDQLQKDVREILIGQYLGSSVEEYLGLNASKTSVRFCGPVFYDGEQLEVTPDGTVVLPNNQEAEYKPYNCTVFKHDDSVTEEYEPDVLDNYDPVEKPAHYNQGGIEAIDYIKQQLGNEGYRAYCLGNVMKYLHRHTYKGKPKEDLAKAVWYLNEAKGTY